MHQLSDMNIVTDDVSISQTRTEMCVRSCVCAFCGNVEEVGNYVIYACTTSGIYVGVENDWQ